MAAALAWEVWPRGSFSREDKKHTQQTVLLTRYPGAPLGSQPPCIFVRPKGCKQE